MNKIIHQVSLDVHKNSIAAVAVSFEDHRRAGYFIRVIRVIRGQSSSVSVFCFLLSTFCFAFS